MRGQPIFKVETQSLRMQLFQQDANQVTNSSVSGNQTKTNLTILLNSESCDPNQLSDWDNDMSAIVTKSYQEKDNASTT